MKKVLLTSESCGFLERNTAFLLRRGFRLFTAMSGAVALNLHKEHHFDLILADHKLEDMSGYILCSQVNSCDHSQLTPVIIICQNSSENVRRATESRASAVLLKPIDPNKLLATITNFIDLQIVKSRRIALKVPVSCRKLEAEFCCLSHDISNTGILIETDQLATGTRIKCEFTLPDSSYVDVEGEVVRIATSLEGKQLCGIKFIQTPLSSLRTIMSYVISVANTAPNSIISHYPSQHCMCT